MKYLRKVWGYTWKTIVSLVALGAFFFVGFTEGMDNGYISGCSLFASEHACITARLVARGRVDLVLPTANDSSSAAPKSNARTDALCEDLRREPGSAAAHLARFVKCS